MREAAADELSSARSALNKQISVSPKVEARVRVEQAAPPSVMKKEEELQDGDVEQDISCFSGRALKECRKRGFARKNQNTGDGRKEKTPGRSGTRPTAEGSGKDERSSNFIVHCGSFECARSQGENVGERGGLIVRAESLGYGEDRRPAPARKGY